jgi:hypothetical protein
MQIPTNITVPQYPRFMFTADQDAMQLYIVCTKPIALIWVRQTIPAQLYIVEGKQDEKLLQDCAEWYRNNAGKSLNLS